MSAPEPASKPAPVAAPCSSNLKAAKGMALEQRLTLAGFIPAGAINACSGEILLAGAMTRPAVRKSHTALTGLALCNDIGDDGSGRRKAAPDEKGIRCGVGNSRQIRDCPRNCKRRATLRNHCSANGMGRRRQAKTRESGDLPSKPKIATRAGCPGRSVLMACNHSHRGISRQYLVLRAAQSTKPGTACRFISQHRTPGHGQRPGLSDGILTIRPLSGRSGDAR